MEFFKRFLRVVGLLEPSKVDFITELPLEVSQLILRKLDAESLLSAAQVSGKWLKVCKSDNVLRRSARRYQRRTRREIREGISEYRPEKRIGQRKKTRDMRKSLQLSLVPRFEAVVTKSHNMRRPLKVPKMINSLDVRPVRCMRL